MSSETSFLVEKLELIRRHIRIIERTLIRLTDETEEGKYLLSIRGLNYAAVAGLLAELGCFKAYRSAKQMIKMAASNPTEYYSAYVGCRPFSTYFFTTNLLTFSRCSCIV